MRLLVFTTLYPNAAAPTHGVFVENRLRAFLDRHDADVRVVAPVPWFPLKSEIFGDYARFARVPESERRHGVQIYHPRYVIPPKTAMRVAPAALARALRRTLDDFARDGWAPDLIDAHYLYPDGVAAARVAKELELPLVLTARGSDATLLPRYEGPRKAILEAIAAAHAVVSVSNSLKSDLAKVGAPRDRIEVLRNGVDLDLFRLKDRDDARRRLGVEGGVIASVGHLIDRKGHDLVIDALRRLPGVNLVIVGDGPRRAALEEQARRSGVAGRVAFLGARRHETLPEIYSAADALVLASLREGWPNVLLEAMACGTPCIASNVGGNAEVISAPEAGRIFTARTPEAIAVAFRDLLADLPARAGTRAHAEKHSWAATAGAMARIFKDAAAKTTSRRAVRITPFKRPAARQAPRLMVTVDTEEVFNWSRFDPDAYRLAAPQDLSPLQSMCEARGIAPLYFLSYPLLRDERIAGWFRALQEASRADCGLHLHAWTTPPINGRGGAYHSYQNNLTQGAAAAKLNVLADAYEAAFGARATSHRAGRYGIDATCYPLLADIGVKYDFSPSAGFDLSADGGPDFTGHSNAPSIVGTHAGALAVTPVSGGRAVRRSNWFPNAAANEFLPKKLTAPARLSPEGASLETLKALTRRLIHDGAPVLTFTLHSTSLTEGGNPYAADAAGVDHILETTRAFLDWFFENDLGEPARLCDLETLYEGAFDLTRL
ncbi:MAG: glycosyltransferase [Pseudomonadota bacterium]